jgi:hypothetical protein
MMKFVHYLFSGHQDWYRIFFDIKIGMSHLLWCRRKPYTNQEVCQSSIGILYRRLRYLRRFPTGIGPAQPKWPHYGKLSGRKKEMHLCHLNKGRPTWVVIWTVLDKQKKIMEINYVGTHENAPY